MADSAPQDVKLCLQILEQAIAFEEEGIRFFHERGQQAASDLERRIFRSLAQDEVGHKAYLVGLRADLQQAADLAALSGPETEHRTAREIFESSLAEASDPHRAEEAELEILQGALEIERRGYEMYRNAAAGVESPRARELFLHLAGEEQQHFQLLSNTLEYLRSPEEWHGYDESPLLDGG